MRASLDTVIERLKGAKKALVIGHVKPDGDDISSVAALVSILRKLGKEAEGCIADRIPWFYHDLPGAALIKDVDELRDYRFDTAITVDASELSRIGKAVELLGGKKPDITLDHHKTNVGFGELDFCDPGYAATAMIVYEIGKRLVPYDPELAEMTLLGIATDTGFFKYASVDHRVFEYAAELVKLGANIQRLAAAVLEHRTPNAVRLLTQMLSTLKIEEDGKLAWAFVSADMLRRTGCTDEDTEGFAGEIRAIHGVEIAILFVEWPEGEVHVSLRSKSYADVSEIALVFGGGGHRRAAGCTCKGKDLAAVIAEVVTEAKRTLRNAGSAVTPDKKRSEPLHPPLS
jgi:phosphoesterase RecJ-like protein